MRKFIKWNRLSIIMSLYKFNIILDYVNKEQEQDHPRINFNEIKDSEEDRWCQSHSRWRILVESPSWWDLNLISMRLNQHTRQRRFLPAGKKYFLNNSKIIWWIQKIIVSLHYQKETNRLSNKLKTKSYAELEL